MNPSYLALGDSLTTGYGVKPSQGFAGLYYQILSEKIPNLAYVNQGINGLTAIGLAQRLLVDHSLQGLTARASLITLTIGSNDLLHFAQETLAGAPPDIPTLLQRFQTDMNHLGQSLRFLNQRTSLQVASLYNPIPAALDHEFARQGQVLLNQANTIIGHWARRHQAILVPVGHAFKGQERVFIGPDNVHPNEAGHAFLACLFAQAQSHRF